MYGKAIEIIESMLYRTVIVIKIIELLRSVIAGFDLEIIEMMDLLRECFLRMEEVKRML